MVSIRWVVRNRYVEPGKLYPSPQGMVEPSPETCRQGHRFGPYRVTVGWGPCRCGGHRTHACRECDDVVQWPEAGADCEDGTFDGRGNR